MPNKQCQLSISEICDYISDSIATAYRQQDKHAKIAITVKYNGKDRVHVEGTVKANNTFVHIPFEVLSVLKTMGINPSTTLKVTSSIKQYD